jgi:hypothetical protein
MASGFGSLIRIKEHTAARQEIVRKQTGIGTGICKD